MILIALAAALPGPDQRPAAARAVVVSYYDAIEHGRYRQAYRLWSGEGRASGQSYTSFVRGFARTRHVRAEVGRPSDSEGAAGSVFITVPVVIVATLKDGTPQRFRGSYVLRRVNDVPGATAAHLRWHIASAKLTRS
ncbi:MAG: hypothetical protein JO157_13225 [Acetobacteraceae bacterium]|nr:hypothetical protein [Acetobacteraceae bacterium]